MRRSPVHERLAGLGASFEEKDSTEVATGFGSIEREYGFVRKSVGLADVSHYQVFRGAEDEAIFYLDEVLAANIANIRYGRMVHTFLADKDGMVVSDVYVANNEDEIIVLCESLLPDREVERLLLGGNNPPLTNITGSTALFSLEGVSAWAVARDLFGQDVLGMPYLSAEPQEIGQIPITLFRAGKTGEFGYLAMCNSDNAPEVFDKLLASTSRNNGGMFGLDAYGILKLDGRFFNINSEGRRVRDPLPLGLQWMIDFTKDRFMGMEALLERRSKGLEQKVIAMRLDAPEEEVAPDDTVSLDNEEVGRIVAIGKSYTLDRQICLSLVNNDVAYSGLQFESGGHKLTSISMPPFVPKSLEIKLDEV
ncbi:MAG: aminomethyl transferase family protein [Deltaproteobacteria bacterium]|nr:aminomethyl transferase family protein [Deltaproteobacteria bacterium]